MEVFDTGWIHTAVIEAFTSTCDVFCHDENITQFEIEVFVFLQSESSQCTGDIFHQVNKNIKEGTPLGGGKQVYCIDWVLF